MRPPAWSSRASRACVSRASGQAGRYADRQGGVRSARQTPRQADRQASTSQAVLSTLHHHPPSAPTAKHGCYTYYNILWHGWQAVQVLQAGCGYAPIQLVLVEPLHTQAVACMLTNVSISSGCARGSLRCQPQWWCCVEWLVLLTRQYGPNSSTKNTSSALRKQARSTQVLLLSCLAGLHSHAAVSADVLVSNMICRWHRSWLQQQSTCMWLHAGQQHASVALSTFHCASALAQCTLL